MKLRLQAKYALMLGGVTLAVSITLTTLFLILAQQATKKIHESSIETTKRALSQEMEARGQGVVAMLTSSLSVPLEANNIEAVESLLNSTLALSDITQIYLYNSHGELIHQEPHGHTSSAIVAPTNVLKQIHGKQSWLFQNDGELAFISGPIVANDRILGAVTVGLSQIRFNNEISAHHTTLDALANESYSLVIGTTLALVPIILILAIILGSRAAKRMSLPIEQLQSGVNSIAHGHYDINWPEQRNDEIGELTEGLKTMVLQLRTRTVSMTYLDDIIGSMFDCLVVTDARQRIEKVNAATCRLTGYASPELVNQPFAKLLVPPGADVAEENDVARLGETIDTIYAKSGRSIPVHLGSAIMASHVDGRPRTVTVFRDVSEQKTREQELRHAKEEAEIANTSKSQFLANMSHELRTPLNAVIGFSSMIKEEIKGPLSDTYKSYAGDIHDSAHHLLAIINDILDISKLEAGKMDVYDEEISIEEIIPTAVRLVRHKADERKIVITTNIEKSFPDIYADQRMLKQILINLLSNAVKFNINGGKIDINATTHRSGASITVSDTGIGMDSADIPHLLEPFAQADSSLNRTYQGTGLGLAITKSMVELHGGHLSIISAVGEGTAITITFPEDRVIRTGHAPISRAFAQ